MAKGDSEHGKKANAEGRMGDKTHSAFLEGLHASANRPNDVDADRLGDASHPTNDGHHRLNEEREQHDEAEKDSEVNRHGH